MIGNNRITLESIDSTNNYIKNNTSKLPHGSVVSALLQTKGRGRLNRTWISDKGNLYFSFILNKGLNYTDLFQVLMKTSVATIKVLSKFNISANIKYPNDILVDYKKICGILIETYSILDSLNYVIGVGVNVNQINFTTIQNKATSIKLQTGNVYDVNYILDVFIEEYNMLSNWDFNKLYEEYIRKSIIIGKHIDYNNNRYLIKTIDKSGMLELDSEGSVTRVSLNEVNLEELYNEFNN